MPTLLRLHRCPEGDVSLAGSGVGHVEVEVLVAVGELLRLELAVLGRELGVGVEKPGYLILETPLEIAMAGVNVVVSLDVSEGEARGRDEQGYVGVCDQTERYYWDVCVCVCVWFFFVCVCVWCVSTVASVIKESRAVGQVTEKGRNTGGKEVICRATAAFWWMGSHKFPHCTVRRWRVGGIAPVEGAARRVAARFLPLPLLRQQRPVCRDEIFIPARDTQHEWREQTRQ